MFWANPLTSPDDTVQSTHTLVMDQEQYFLMWKIAYYYYCDIQLIVTVNINTSYIPGSMISTLLFYWILTTDHWGRDYCHHHFIKGNWGLVLKKSWLLRGTYPLQPLLFLGTKRGKRLNSQNSYHKTLKLGSYTPWKDYFHSHVRACFYKKQTWARRSDSRL